MPEHSDSQIALFIRDEKTGRYTFNARALKVLGIDPAAARERGYPLRKVRKIQVELGCLNISSPHARSGYQGRAIEAARLLLHRNRLTRISFIMDHVGPCWGAYERPWRALSLLGVWKNLLDRRERFRAWRKWSWQSLSPSLPVRPCTCCNQIEAAGSHGGRMTQPGEQ